MGSYKDFQTEMICSDGWWNPRRSSALFPPCAAPLSDFMWTSSSLTSMDKQTDQMQPQLADASYSRSDDSDDHQSSSTEHLTVISSDYSQIFTDVQKPQLDDFGVSDWLQNNLWNDQTSSHDFFNQFEVSQMALGSSYPAVLQNQVEPDSVTNYIFDNNFVASTTTSDWPRPLSPKINHGSKPSNDKNYTTPFWDSWTGSEDIGALESHQLIVPAVFEDQKPYKKDYTSYNLPDTTTGTKRKIINDEVYKRPRIVTPSSLPTFKVRKEKLGDRITALQQLVSPFGKTDTASVLHEAVEYIKFLHDQVLRSPYMQNGTTTNQHQQVQGESENTQEGPNKDLRSRGLCLVPISSTFPVANETSADFWTPSFGGTMAFR